MDTIAFARYKTAREATFALVTACSRVVAGKTLATFPTSTSVRGQPPILANQIGSPVTHII